MNKPGLYLSGYDIENVPDEVINYPGMTNPRERGMLYWLAKNHYQGKGVIVDAGLFFGASTNAFAVGLKDNAHPSAAKPSFPQLNSYDTAIWVRGMDRFLTQKNANARRVVKALNGRTLRPGQSFLPVLKEMLSAHLDMIDFRIGDIVKLAATDRPVEIAFYDCLKTHEREAAAFMAFAPHYIPGQTIVVQQDYFYESAAALKIRQEYLAPWFSYIGYEATSAVFRMEKPIPIEFFREDPVADLSVDDRIALLDQAAERADDPRLRLNGKLCMVDYLLEVGKRNSARERLEAILSDVEGDLEERFGARMKTVVNALRKRATA